MHSFSTQRRSWHESILPRLNLAAVVKMLKTAGAAAPAVAELIETINSPGVPEEVLEVATAKLAALLKETNYLHDLPAEPVEMPSLRGFPLQQSTHLVMSVKSGSKFDPVECLPSGDKRHLDAGSTWDEAQKRITTSLQTGYIPNWLEQLGYRSRDEDKISRLGETESQANEPRTEEEKQWWTAFVDKLGGLTK